MKIKGLPRLGHLQCWQNPPVCASWMPRSGLVGEGHLGPSGGECFPWSLIAMCLLQAPPCWVLGSPDDVGQTTSQSWGERSLCDPFLLLDVGQGTLVLATFSMLFLQSWGPQTNSSSSYHCKWSTLDATCVSRTIAVLSREKQGEIGLHYFVRLQKIFKISYLLMLL